MNNRLIKSNDAGGGACTNTVDLYNPFPDGGGLALYQLNGNANDVSGNYNATGVSGVTWGTTGVFGTCADLTLADNSTITLPNSSPIPSNLNFTVSLWIKGNDISTSTDDICIANLYGSYFLLGVKSNKLTVLFSDSSSQANRFESPAILNSSTFNHVVVSSNGLGSTCSVYINGSNVGTFSMASTTRSLTLGNAIGGMPGIIQYGFQGQIDQVRFFSRALRPYEVEALYTEEYCTPTIVPSEHFNTVTYTGNGGTQTVTTGFQTDFAWIKNRVRGNSHALSDSVRGFDRMLSSDRTDAESLFFGTGQKIQNVTSTSYDVFTPNPGFGEINYTGDDFVAWNFKAGGAAVTNTDGTITSQVSANTEAGFSIVSYTGNGVQGATIGNGLNSENAFIIVKNRSVSVNWGVWHKGLSPNGYLTLNTTNAEGIASSVFPVQNEIGKFAVGTDGGVNVNNQQYIAYCFAEVEGFSNFGSFVGTGTSVNVITGFEPAFVIWKNISQGSASYDYWFTVDNKRSPENPIKKVLYPNDSSAEDTTTTYDIANFYENGFQIVGNQGGNRVFNNAGDTYIYMAFAADPTAVEPTLEDSFNTVVYTGNGSTQSITGVGFQPDFTWIKDRTTAYHHILQDSVRGINSKLGSDGTWEENNAAELSLSYGQITSFDSNGFTVNGTSQLNRSGDNFVAWAWKGAEIPAINSNGSIPSVVSANPAAGFSIVSYTGNSIIGSTVGHGLNAAPDVVIYKGRQEGLPQYFASWGVYHSSLGATQRLWLNNTGAAQTAGGGDWINNTEPTDSVFTVGEYYTNWTGRDFIAYCFAEVAGFSKFGSYTGNGSTNGPTITTGFEPAFVMFKGSSIATEWGIFDNKRDTVNPNTAVLLAQSSQAEAQATGGGVNFLSNGFQLNDNNSNRNSSGQTYIYMAFANQF